MTPIDANESDPVPAGEPAPATPPSPAAEYEGGPAPERSPWPVRIAMGVVVVLALAALFWPSSPERYRAPAGTPLDAAGRPTPLGVRLAPVSLLHFWATWCPPCIVEIPKLREFTGGLAADHRFGLVMVAVAEESQRVNDFLGPAEAGEMLYDPKWEVANRYGTEQLPETYLVVDGDVVDKFVGATDWSDPKVRQRVLQHLK